MVVQQSSSLLGRVAAVGRFLRQAAVPLSANVGVGIAVSVAAKTLTAAVVAATGIGAATSAGSILAVGAGTAVLSNALVTGLRFGIAAGFRRIAGDNDNGFAAKAGNLFVRKEESLTRNNFLKKAGVGSVISVATFGVLQHEAVADYLNQYDTGKQIVSSLRSAFRSAAGVVEDYTPGFVKGWLSSAPAAKPQTSVSGSVKCLYTESGASATIAASGPMSDKEWTDCLKQQYATHPTVSAASAVETQASATADTPPEAERLRGILGKAARAVMPTGDTIPAAALPATPPRAVSEFVQGHIDDARAVAPQKDIADSYVLARLHRLYEVAHHATAPESLSAEDLVKAVYNGNNPEGFLKALRAQADAYAPRLNPDGIAAVVKNSDTKLTVEAVNWDVTNPNDSMATPKVDPYVDMGKVVIADTVGADGKHQTELLTVGLPSVEDTGKPEGGKPTVREFLGRKFGIPFAGLRQAAP